MCAGQHSRRSMENAPVDRCSLAPDHPDPCCWSQTGAPLTWCSAAHRCRSAQSATACTRTAAGGQGKAGRSRLAQVAVTERHLLPQPAIWAPLPQSSAHQLESRLIRQALVGSQGPPAQLSRASATVGQTCSPLGQTPPAGGPSCQPQRCAPRPAGARRAGNHVSSRHAA